VVRPLRHLLAMTSPRNRRILVIDDMESIQRDFRKALAPPSAGNGLADLEAGLFGREGSPAGNEVVFEASYASQGLEGVELARQALAEGRPFALAFVDIRMPPGLDGIETIIRLWEVDSRLEVVICTAYSDYSWREMLERLARTAQFLVLNKPFDGTVVKQMALGLTEKWNLTRAAERSSAHLEFLVVERAQQLFAANQQLKMETHDRTQMERRLRHSQKLESLGRLVGGVAHEINNPLTVVLANLDYMKHELKALGAESDPRVLQLGAVTDETRDGGKRIQQIVKDLQAFSQTDQQTVEDVNLRSTLEFALRMSKASFPESLQVTTHCDDDLPPVNGSPGQLLQVFLHLIVNAALSMRSVEVSRRKLDVAIRRSADGRVVIKVADHGVGISSENLPKVFDPFFTTREVGAGTGLGLSVCHGFVEELGGDISLDSRLGEGTVAKVIIPPRPPRFTAALAKGIAPSLVGPARP
jgi:two-component system NtrC family sensor kinase